ncbi:MAG: phosphatase PAP2 family protein [Ktedonobacteraceae bacterium]|nr:phosphatase PAP2 family protein [Ktedonobacteraceae bacterium]
MRNTKETGVQSVIGAMTSGSRDKRNAHNRHVVEAILWIIGVIVLAIFSVVVHMHLGPWPVDLQTTIAEQRISYPSWIHTIIDLVSHTNDPIPAGVALGIWAVGLLIFRKWLQALFIAGGTLLSDWINFMDNILVGRPRPNSPLIHIFQPEPIKSFPSGHVEHDVVYYGFLLYLSFTKPVRQWRYYRLLLPLQIIAAFIIVTIGFSRIYEGSHWLTDVLGGYLSGAVLLLAVIWLYRWATAKLAERRARKMKLHL